MFTVYIDEHTSNHSAEVLKDQAISPAAFFSGRTGVTGIISDNGQKMPMVMGFNLSTYALEKRYGIVEPLVVQSGAFVPDVSLTKDDVEKFKKGWL